LSFLLTLLLWSYPAVLTWSHRAVLTLYPAVLMWSYPAVLTLLRWSHLKTLRCAE